MDKTEIVEQWVRAVEQGDTETLERITSTDFVFEHGAAPAPMDRRTFLRTVRALHNAFPDWRFNASEFDEWEHEVRSPVHITASHRGDLDLSFLGLPRIAATGKQIHLPREAGRWHVEDGKVVGHQVRAVPGGGLTGILEQIGAQPPPAGESVDFEEADQEPARA